MRMLPSMLRISSITVSEDYYVEVLEAVSDRLGEFWLFFYSLRCQLDQIRHLRVTPGPVSSDRRFLLWDKFTYENVSAIIQMLKKFAYVAYRYNGN